jgi:hypothetical protein
VKVALGLESKDAIVGFLYVGTDDAGPGSLPRPDWRNFVQDWPPTGAAALEPRSGDVPSGER